MALKTEYGKIISMALFDTLADFPITGTEHILYKTEDTEEFFTWSLTALSYVPFGVGGVGTISYLTTVTKVQADVLIATDALTPGHNYKITGVNSTLYGGVDIILTACSVNTFSIEGIGFFYNPNYIINDIWNSFSTYSINAKTIWGGKVWNNVAGNVGSAIDDFTLNNEWVEVSYNTTYYNLVADEISYNYSMDIITSRKDKNNNVVEFYDDFYILASDAIRFFQWGRDFDGGSGSYNNRVSSSVVNNINSTYSIFSNNELRGNAILSGLADASIFTGNILINSELSGVIYNVNQSVFNNIVLTGFLNEGTGIDKVIYSKNCIEYSIPTLTFTGASGAGAIGNYTLPTDYFIPIGFCLEEVIVKVETTLVGSGNINFGILTENETIGLDNVSGKASSLNSNGIKKVLMSTYYQAVGNNKLNLKITGASITGGSISLKVKLIKI